ncbi:hypothetical protein [Arenimonas terrae]|uniref:Uncharacterized protein n=1 Tax=Arenimonas terrae TaxID=2546226 RepID=A0A5C4RS89_9GAMM|nr:hypothetical protein [Arenimonas terrae]TNJ33829.1 hypothetical protein E1B00_10895 [Arenimonas terrae]
MQQKFFFQPSKSVAKRLTETFDFVWPTAAAIWNLRWQVVGIVQVCPDISEAELLGRFVAGSEIRGANLKKACITTSWSGQQRQFAKFLLFEFCALYEWWCESMHGRLSLPDGSSKALQFPTSTKGNVKRGVGSVIDAATASGSSVVGAAFFPSLKTNKKYAPIQIESLLTCYRYFKELRNSLIHGSGDAVEKLKSSETNYRKLSAADLRAAEVPAFIPYSGSGDPDISLRGVVGFGEIVLMLVSTLDIELSKTALSEIEFKECWSRVHGDGPREVATVDANRRAHRIRVLSKNLGLPTPKVSVEFEEWLRANRLVHY